MAELATIARPYAEALFRVAQGGNMSAWTDLISEMAAVAALSDVKAFISNPRLSNREAAATFLSLLKSDVPPEAKNFVQMLVENGRLALLPEIGEQFHALRNEAAGAADADIDSAFEMTDAQVRKLTATLERKFGRKLNPSVKVDKGLIGGIRVTVGDEVLDTSVRAKLQKMYVSLTS